MTQSSPSPPPAEAPLLPTESLRPLLEALGSSPDALRSLSPRPGLSSSAEPGDVLLELPGPELPGDERLASLLAQVQPRWSAAGLLLVLLPGRPEDALLAQLRNRLWPAAHAVGVYRGQGGRWRGWNLQGAVPIEGSCAGDAVALACRHSAFVLSPRATQEKFDQNATGWNGDPGSPGYRHFRWMRRLVGCFGPPAAPGSRILDFGCGAGWVGIEAALAAGVQGIELCSFDPSPEMVRITGENAAAQGIGAFTGRVGFGEEPPFPAEGEPRYQRVISSGVVSFARDFEQWMGGLDAAVERGGTLILGDINPRSRGMAQRRASKPLLPVREMNARTARECRTWLEARGYTHEETTGYQLTFPVPQAMHLNETRLKGLLSLPLVGLNALATGLDRAAGNRLAAQFDSWVMRLRAPAR